MSLHKLLYSSWYAIAAVVWGTWALLKALEASTIRAWYAYLFAVGFLGGTAFLSKQNAGIFFLWGVTGFLASVPASMDDCERVAAPGGRFLRIGYLGTIALGTFVVVRRLLSPLIFLCFVAPSAALAAMGATRRCSARALARLLAAFGVLGAGVLHSRQGGA